MKKNYLTSALFGVLISVVVGVMLPVSITHALPGGVAIRRGYFHNLKIDNDNIDPVLLPCNGDPFDASMDNNKAAFIDRIMSYYSGDCISAKNKLGVEFVMLTMMDTRGSLDIDAWKAYINGSNLGIKWVYGAGFNYNSGYYGPGTDGPDEYFVYGSGNHDALVFYDVNSGIPIYQLKSNCGNPVGSTVEPIVTQWEVVPSVSVNRGTANVNDNIIWTYNVAVANHTIDTSVAYGWRNTGGSNTSSGQQGALDSGTGVGPGATFTKTYTVQASDAGKSLCGATYSNPGWSDNRVYRESAGACVSIAAPVVIPNPCRPIVIPVPAAKTYTVSEYKPADGNTYPAIVTTVPIQIYYEDQVLPAPYNISYTTATNVTDPWLTRQATAADSGGIARVIKFVETTSHKSSYSGGNEKLCWIQTSPGSAGPPVVSPTYGWGSCSPKQYYPVTTNSTSAATIRYDTLICYDYSLTAEKSEPSNKIVEAGSAINLTQVLSSKSYTSNNAMWTPFVNLDGLYSDLHTNTKQNTSWRITQLVTQPGGVRVSTIANGDSSDPCAYYNSHTTASCSTLSSGVATFSSQGDFYNWGGSNPTSIDTVIGDYQPGTTICYAFSIYASESEPHNGGYVVGTAGGPPAIPSSLYDQNGGHWNNSRITYDQNCLLVVKKPKTQIWGGDLWVNGTNSSISASNSARVIGGNSYRFGSWVEYGVLSSGTVSGIASGSAFASGLMPSGSGPCLYNTLTFTNASCSDLGHYKSSNSLPSVESLTANFPGGKTINTSSVIVNNL